MSGAARDGDEERYQGEQPGRNARETGEVEAIITRRKILLLCAILPASLEAFSAECFSSKSSVTLVASFSTSSGRSASFASRKPGKEQSLAYT